MGVGKMDSKHLKLADDVLDVRDLVVLRSGKVILKDINLRIQRGEFVGIVGPNGSGKSTLLLSILGILKNKSGKIKVYGKSPKSKKLIGKVGWVSQAASNLPSDIRITVRELVQLGTVNLRTMLMFPTLTMKSKVDRAIEMVGLVDEQNTDVSKLSGGQRQRAVIARALASDAEFILLDEPLVGIDRESRNNLLKLLDNLCHEEDKTILMVSHDLTAMKQTAHRMIFLEEDIKFDGETCCFPDFETLAKLRGIKSVHDTSTNTVEEE